jgi:hypothetical protein
VTQRFTDTLKELKRKHIKALVDAAKADPTCVSWCQQNLNKKKSGLLKEADDNLYYKLVKKPSKEIKAYAIDRLAKRITSFIRWICSEKKVRQDVIPVPEVLEAVVAEVLEVVQEVPETVPIVITRPVRQAAIDGMAARQEQQRRSAENARLIRGEMSDNARIPLNNMHIPAPIPTSDVIVLSDDVIADRGTADVLQPEDTCCVCLDPFNPGNTVASPCRLLTSAVQ